MRPERRTKQKQAVYEALCALDHPTATEVYESMRESHPSISRGTVFRVLGSFAETGRIRKICLTDSDARFDYRLDPHAHVRCRNCGKVGDVPLPQLGNVAEGVNTAGFTIDGFELEFFGLCEKCRKKLCRGAGKKEIYNEGTEREQDGTKLDGGVCGGERGDE